MIHRVTPAVSTRVLTLLLVDALDTECAPGARGLLPESLSEAVAFFGLFSCQWEPYISTDVKTAPHYCRVIKNLIIIVRCGSVASDSSQNTIILFSY